MPFETTVKLASGGLIEERLRKTQDAIDKATYTAEESWKDRIQSGPKTGRKYRRGKGRVHQASAPGESPATDTGRLVGSIHSEIKHLEGTVAANAEYAADLEEGTPGGQMAPRPAAKPAFHDGKKVLYEELKR